jgi:hypothetical protein
VLALLFGVGLIVAQPRPGAAESPFGAVDARASADALRAGATGSGLPFDCPLFATATYPGSPTADRLRLRCAESATIHVKLTILG